MYTEFYGLREKPFALSPDPRYLYLAEAHREALAHLVYGIEQGEGFIAVTGEVGTGKTTLCRTLLQRLGAETEVAFIFNPDLSPVELLQSIARELGIQTSAESRRDLVDAINAVLLARRREERRVLLIIDEAQNLSPETLEQVRLLSNLETETSKLIQIVLLGQPELDAKLHTPALRQLRQRITVWWRLVPLSPAETHEYVRHRLRIAGAGSRSLFDEPALREIHRRSRGIPRLVNVLADRALLAGYGGRANAVGRSEVLQAAREIGEPAGRPTPRSWPRGRGLAPLARLVPQPLLWIVLVALVLGGVTGRWIGGSSPAPPAEARPAEARQGDPAMAPVAAAPRPEPRSPDVAAPPPASIDAPRSPVPSGDGALPAPSARSLADENARAAARRAEIPTPTPAVAPTTKPALELGLVELETFLGSLSQRESHVVAVAAMLDLWSLPTPPPRLASLSEGLRVLDARGLSVQPLPSADVVSLEILNHPAILVIEGPDGTPRSVSLRRLDLDRATLAGVEGQPDFVIPIGALEERWLGESYVVWRDFEPLPAILREGQAGTSVLWLQETLAALGFYGWAPSGRFDAATAEAVRAFQQSRGLEADGEVGPRTKMSIYEALDDYAVPRLVLGSPDGGGVTG